VVFIRLSLLLLTLIFISGCQLPYLAKSAYHHLVIMKKRVPIEKSLKDKTIPKKIKGKLKLAQKAKIFSEQELKLDSTNNYSSFAQLDEKYVSYIISVAPLYELKHHKWKFPFIGSVPYKGFHTHKEAEEEALKYPKSDFDTYIRGATAYSTLGWFDDPILSSMLRYKDYNLVNVIIHETVHATIYIKDHADFNERLATFIGNKGTELFYKKHFKNSKDILLQIQNENHDDKIFSDFVSATVKQLNIWYTDKENHDLQKKDAYFQALLKKFKSEILPKMKSKQYRHFHKNKFNNAKLLSLKTYFYDLSDFEKAFKKFNSDFEKFISFCKKLEDQKDPEAYLKKFVLVN
jgi:predicted aminopeptidase